MAAAIGRLTGHPGVALSTLGPLSTNFLTAIAHTQLGDTNRPSFSRELSHYALKEFTNIKSVWINIDLMRNNNSSRKTVFL